jgi:hypothetical protein
MGTCEFTLDRYKTFFNHVVSCVWDYQLINRKFNPSKTVTSWCQTSRRDFRFFGAALSTARESETPWKRTPGLCCRTRWVHKRPRIQQSNPARRRGGHGRAHPMRASGRENRMWMQWYRYRDAAGMARQQWRRTCTLQLAAAVSEHSASPVAPFIHFGVIWRDRYVTRIWSCYGNRHELRVEFQLCAVKYSTCGATGVWNCMPIISN